MEKHVLSKRRRTYEKNDIKIREKWHKNELKKEVFWR